MPYHEAIIKLAQHLSNLIFKNPDMGSIKFYMLWNTLLKAHFPDLGVSPETQYLVVVLPARNLDPVLVVKLKKPAENTSIGRQALMEELAAYTEERLNDTQFSTIYAVGGIGLSFAVLKMQRSSPKPELVFDWDDDVVSAASFDRMNQVASMITEMIGVITQG